MLRAQRRDPAKAQAKCAFATNYPLANRQLRSPLILRYRMQRDKPFAKLTFVGLQQRLLSSIAAFSRTLKTHRATLEKVLDGEEAVSVAAAANAFVETPSAEDSADLGLEDQSAEFAIDADEEANATAASAAGAIEATHGDLKAELAAVDEMLTLAEKHIARPDARVRWLVEWIRNNMMDGPNWNRRRLGSGLITATR